MSAEVPSVPPSKPRRRWLKWGVLLAVVLAIAVGMVYREAIVEYLRHRQQQAIVAEFADCGAMAAYDRDGNVFSLGFNPPEREDLKDAHLRSVARLERLRYLNLWGTGVTDLGMKHLAGLKDLKRLNLGRTKVTDAGLEQLTGLTGLERINVDGCAVTRQGLASVKKALPTTVIQFGEEVRGGD